jgi:hypothetical protein
VDRTIVEEEAVREVVVPKVMIQKKIRRVRRALEDPPKIFIEQQKREENTVTEEECAEAWKKAMILKRVKEIEEMHVNDPGRADIEGLILRKFGKRKIMLSMKKIYRSKMLKLMLKLMKYPVKWKRKPPDKLLVGNSVRAKNPHGGECFVKCRNGNCTLFENDMINWFLIEKRTKSCKKFFFP